MGLNGQIPAEKCDIKIGENKLTLIQNSSKII